MRQILLLPSPCPGEETEAEKHFGRNSTARDTNPSSLGSKPQALSHCVMLPLIKERSITNVSGKEGKQEVESSSHSRKIGKAPSYGSCSIEAIFSALF